MKEEKLSNLQVLLEHECDNFVGWSTNTPTSVTGEYYVTLMSGGIKPEGAQVRYFDEKGEAIRAFLASFKSYREGQGPGYLYWRSTPRLIEADNKFCVWSRLLISAKVPYGQREQ